MARATNPTGQRRVVIDRLEPQIDGGRFPIKRVVTDTVVVHADIVADGHDLITAVVLYRTKGARSFGEVPMVPDGNDRYHAAFFVEREGEYFYTVEAWIDHFATWCAGLEKKHDAGVATEMDLLIGARLVEEASGRAKGEPASRLSEIAAELRDTGNDIDHRVATALSTECRSLVWRYPDRRYATRYERELRVWVDRERAIFSSWYELFPRSTAAKPGKHGGFSDLIKRLPYVARLGFDVLYLPPIHPIGVTNRKGRNNALTATKSDPGSPWAIGGAAGGHKAIHPELGTPAEFRDLVERARSYRMEVALDIAFQCSPDHPWVTEHPEWFVARPDGSIQYAENPPKKYEDIYPINFETTAWESLWAELKSVFEHWIDQGVRIFRVDNPHTKSFPFWEWVIDQIHRRDTGVIFLAEAFTRPKRMYRLAKAGFTQSYTYFAWRNSASEMRDYLTELTQTEVKEYFRPNFWPNTPDILHEDLQSGNRAAFIVRLVLAATLSSNYGVYGPAFELLEHTPRATGSEEYLDSEKYEIRNWDLESERSIASVVTRVNEIRRSNRSLHRTDGLRFHECDNPAILCYSKSTSDGENVLLVCANMDYEHTQSGFVEFSPSAVGLDERRPFLVRDLLSDVTFTWRDYWNYIELDPSHTPSHVLLLER